MSFANLKVGTRLAVGFGVVVLGLLVLAATAWYAVDAQSDAASDALDTRSAVHGRLDGIGDLRLDLLRRETGGLAEDRDHRAIQIGQHIGRCVEGHIQAVDRDKQRGDEHEHAVVER